MECLSDPGHFLADVLLIFFFLFHSDGLPSTELREESHTLFYKLRVLAGVGGYGGASAGMILLTMLEVIVYTPSKVVCLGMLNLYVPGVGQITVLPQLRKCP